MVCRDFIPHEFCKPCLFLSISYLRKLSYLIHQREYPSSGQNRNLSVVKLWSNEKSPPNWRWFSLKMVDLIGIEPTTLRMRTVRSPSWAIGPYCRFLQVFCNKKLIFKFSDFRRIQRKTSPKSWTETRRSMCDHRDANRTLSQLSYGPMCLTREIRALNCVWDVARVTTAWATPPKSVA